MYVPADEEAPPRFEGDGSSPKQDGGGGGGGGGERQGLLAGDGSLAAPYVSHASAR